jgi:hypothetical protein
MVVKPVQLVGVGVVVTVVLALIVAGVLVLAPALYSFWQAPGTPEHQDVRVRRAFGSRQARRVLQLLAAARHAGFYSFCQAPGRARTPGSTAFGSRHVPGRARTLQNPLTVLSYIAPTSLKITCAKMVSIKDQLW